MFLVETRNSSRADAMLQLFRARGVRPPHLLFDTILDEYGDHESRLSTLPQLVQQDFVEACDEIVSREQDEEPVRLIRIRGHSDRGAGSNDEKSIAAKRAFDVWKNMERNLGSRGFAPPRKIQVILESIGMLEPRDGRPVPNTLNRRVEIFLFDHFENPPI